MIMKKEIYLNDLLHIKEFNNYYVRFVKKWGKDSTSDPLARYHNNPDDPISHLLWKGDRETGFQIGTRIIGLIKLSNDSWLFTHVLEITNIHLRSKGERPNSNEQINFWYDYKIVEDFQKFYGRLIVNYHNNSQNMIKKPKILDTLVVTELLNTNLIDKKFPGYSNVNLTWNELKLIITRENREWMTALKNQKGIYLISDTSNGKTYVGSAYGLDMIWGRWLSYVDNGHGGNSALTELSFDYIKENFKYSILEIADGKSSDDYIISRENWWKEVLQSRKFGYNLN